MIGLIGAMQVEMEQLLSHLEGKEAHTIGSMTFYTGNLYGQDAVLAICGPGKINAALCAQAMILTFKPEWVMNEGGKETSKAHAHKAEKQEAAKAQPAAEPEKKA